MLRRELEILMGERQTLLRVVGSAAALIVSLDSKRLPVGAVEAADMVATSINARRRYVAGCTCSVRAEIEEEGN